MREPVPFVDLSRQWRQIAATVMPDIDALFNASAFCLGPWVERFEKDIAGYLGVNHAIGVNSGTSALHLAMIAAGIGPGDEVLVPSHTFVASAWPVLYAGATPVLCDVRPDSGTLDVADAERRISPAARAIVAVHLYGQPCDMDAVCSFAARHDLVVIEDACQALGARWNGRLVGGIGKLGCFSFYPTKNLGAAGEGGLVVTSDSRMAARIRALRDHAQSEKYVHAELGFNYRMEGLQGLVLHHKLRKLEEWVDERRDIARHYSEGLSGLPLALPQEVNTDHVWHLYVVRTTRRDALRAHLATRGVETGLHYPVPIHRQPAFARYRFDQRSYPISDRFADECLSLPMFVGMSGDEIGHVVAAVRTFFE